jgi:voltage-gated sodium channel
MEIAAIKAKIVGTVESAFFRNFIVTVTILAGVLVGLETVPELVDRHGQILKVLDHFIIWVFIGEFLLKVSAQGRKPWCYFYDYWNVF